MPNVEIADDNSMSAEIEKAEKHLKNFEINTSGHVLKKPVKRLIKSQIKKKGKAVKKSGAALNEKKPIIKKNKKKISK